jgi:hypothetical protein
MKRIKSSTGRVYHLQDDWRSNPYPLCNRYIPRSSKSILTADQAAEYSLCKACDKVLAKHLDELMIFASTGHRAQDKKDPSKFDEFLTDLADLTQEYGEEETIFGMQILALKKRYRKA